MNRALTVAKAGAGAAALAAAATRGWPVLVTFGGLLALLLGAVCWIIASTDRTARLALIISAVRGTQPARARLVKPRRSGYGPNP